MQLSERLRLYRADKEFCRRALGVMLPVAVQQLINSLFNMVDNLMVGSLDPNGLAMSAVSVANKPYTIFNCLLFGLTGWRLPSPVESALSSIGSINTPMAMMVIGSSLAHSDIRAAFSNPRLYF